MEVVVTGAAGYVGSHVFFMKIRLERNNGAQHLIETHTLPFQNGIPVRLFVRYLGKFSRDLDMIYSTDSDDILK
jgi:hypothetical protein